MPFCPTCRAEYRAGFTECADCHVPLVETLKAPEAPPGDLVAVYQGPVIQAEVLGRLLESEGILADVSASETGIMAPHTVNAAGVIRVMVAQRDAERARAVIEAARTSGAG